MSDFHRTNMGHQFYEGTMPALVKQLKRLNDNLERIYPKDTPAQPEEKPHEVPRT